VMSHMKFGQVWWGCAMEALVGKNAKLESDAPPLSDWQPM